MVNLKRVAPLKELEISEVLADRGLSPATTIKHCVPCTASFATLLAEM